MKERPILFSGKMSRALLAGTKLQTRRGFSEHMEKLMRAAAAAGEVSHFMDEGRMQPNDIDYVRSFCPYGKIGDRLWVREAWRTTGDGGRCDEMPPRDLQPHQVWYEADGKATAEECAGKLRPSMFMPRWASRLTLEIVGVRMERLQDISESDAIAEGCTNSPLLPGGRFANENFAHLWWDINGDGSWEANPWVWVVEFKRIDKENP